MSPFQEMEIAMNSFRNAAVSSFQGLEDPFTVSLQDEMEGLLDNSRNLMSMLPVRPSNGSNQRGARLNAPNSHVSRRNYGSNRNSQELDLGNYANADNDNILPTAPIRNRNSSLRNFLDRNNHVFPAPQSDRNVWYDPNEAIPENRLPHIPPRILTLAQINRIPTKKVVKEGGSCDICLDDFKKGESTKVLNCKHDYHTKCVDPWLKQHTTCPKCRRQVRPPPQNPNRPPRPVPPPCPVRERARAYDRERRARARLEETQQRIQEEADNAETGADEIQAVVNLPPVENPAVSSSSVQRQMTTEFPISGMLGDVSNQTEVISEAHAPTDVVEEVPHQPSSTEQRQSEE